MIRDNSVATLWEHFSVRTLAELNRQYEESQRSAEFSAYCLALMRHPKSLLAAHDDAVRAGAPDRVVAILKAAVGAGSTTDSNWASQLAAYRTLSTGFLEGLRSQSAFDASLSAMMPLPARTNLIVVASSFSAALVSEGEAKPLTASVISSSPMPLHKAATIIALSSPVVRHGGANTVGLLGRELRRGISAETDQLFLSEIAAGLTPLTSSGDSFLADLRALLESVTIGADARLFLACDPAIAKQLACSSNEAGELAFPGLTVNGGVLNGITIVASDGAAGSNAMTLFDASQIAGDGGTIVVEPSRHTSLQMSDSPTADGGSGTGATAVSMWQTNMVAIRAEREFSVLRGRTTAAAHMTGVDYAPSMSG